MELSVSERVSLMKRCHQLTSILQFTEKKSKKSKKKAATLGMLGSDTENLFQIVDQADLSETDIEVRNTFFKNIFEKFYNFFQILYF
jgi:hypothetical protein